MADERFECGFCADSYNLSQRVFLNTVERKNEDCMCMVCLVQTFHDAYNSTNDPDLGWGVTWGQDTYLEARDYISVLGEDFVAKYEARQREFDISREARVYCPHEHRPEDDTRSPHLEEGGSCGGFLGEATSAGGKEAACPKCDRWVCMTCRKATNLEGPRHECSGAPQAQQLEDVLPADWVRGNHYQRCPGCDTAYEHLMACNYVLCQIRTCSTGFCFICGKEAIHKPPYTHWQKTDEDDTDFCPLHGKKGDPRAIPANREDFLTWFRIDMPTLKAAIAQVLATYSLPILFPKWIRDGISDDWNLIYLFVNDEPRRVIYRVPTAPRPETTYQEQKILAALDVYLNWNSQVRLRNTIQHIRDKTPEALIMVDEPEERWAGDLQQLWDMGENIQHQRRRYSLTALDIVTFFLLMERMTGVVNDCSWTQHVPRNTSIMYWMENSSASSAPESSNADYSVTFGTLWSESEYIPRTDEQRKALERLERLLLDNPRILLEVVCLLQRSHGDPDRMPPPPVGHEAIELSYFRMSLLNLFENIADYLQDQKAIERHPDSSSDSSVSEVSLPEFWGHPDMPLDDTVILAWHRDGQALRVFDHVRIAGFARNDPTDDAGHRALEVFCRYVVSMESPGELLYLTMFLADINEIEGETTLEELNRNVKYRALRDGKLAR